MEKLDKKHKKDSSFEDLLKAIAIGLLFLFLGLRTGMGFAVKGKMAENDLKLKNSIEFEDGKRQKIALLGQNSLYLFYVEEGDKMLTISPIENNI